MTAAPGPSDPLRSIAAENLLASARAAAAEAGVTRLAEVTRLDRLGLPVWQAIRPMSRALSVHQGKGATDADARLGALLEAVESHAAETFDREGPVCAFEALPERARAPTIADFARDRKHPPAADGPHRWVEAEDLATGDPLYLPFDLVSLDLTRGVPSLFDRASNGVATGAGRGEALAAALCEFVERDSVTEWQAGGPIGCMKRILDLDSVPFAWLTTWRERIEQAGAILIVYAVPSVAGLPVFACEIDDLGKEGAPYAAIQGRGCHPFPEIALFKALAEAIQGRATYIAGAREDMLPSTYASRPAATVTVAFGLPLPPGMHGLDFAEIPPGPGDSAAIAAALAAAGYGRIAIVELGRPHGFHIVRAFVCGLGSIRRRRRPPPP
jgi:ribosomal protein S12 methylthiotransferase accessory factor